MKEITEFFPEKINGKLKNKSETNNFKKFVEVGIPQLKMAKAWKDVYSRVIPYYQTEILPKLKEGKKRHNCRPRQFSARSG